MSSICGFNMKLMFLDESGHHNLDPQKADPTYPIFVLCGCIFNEEYYQDHVIKKFSDLKKYFFGSKNIIFHTLEMTRPLKTKERRYDKLNDPDFRIKFYQGLNKFIEEIEFILVACVIKKPIHIQKYGLSALDPYLLSFDNLLNEFILELKKAEQGKIIAERRNSVLDNQLELAWLNAKINGTDAVKGSNIKEKIENLYLTPKSANEAGLQIADLVANPVGRNVLRIPTKPNHEVDYVLLEKKFSKKRKDGSFGLIILPK